MFSWRNKKDQHFSDEKSALSVAMVQELGSKMDLFKFLDKYGKGLRSNI